MKGWQYLMIYLIKRRKLQQSLKILRTHTSRSGMSNSLALVGRIGRKISSSCEHYYSVLRCFQKNIIVSSGLLQSQKNNKTNFITSSSCWSWFSPESFIFFINRRLCVLRRRKKHNCLIFLNLRRHILKLFGIYCEVKLRRKGRKISGKEPQVWHYIISLWRKCNQEQKMQRN